MLEALESMRTKEELCNYLKLIGIKDIEKTVEKLKQMYNNANFQGQALSFEQLDQVAGGLECFVDPHSKVTFSPNDQDSLTVHIGNKIERYSIDNIENLCDRHKEVFIKLCKCAGSYYHSVKKQLYQSKFKKDSDFLDKFIAKEQNALIAKQRSKNVSRPKGQGKTDVKIIDGVRYKMATKEQLDEEEATCSHGLKVLAAILILSGFGLGVTYLVPYLKKHKIKF